MASQQELCQLCLELNQKDGTKLCQLISSHWAAFRKPHQSQVTQALSNNRGFRENCPWHEELYPPNGKVIKRRNNKK